MSVLLFWQPVTHAYNVGLCMYPVFCSVTYCTVG